MAGFDLDYSEATDFQTVSDGTYEAVINGLKEDTTKSGAQFINVDMIIRNDIEANAFKDQHVFRRIFAKKDTGKYPKGMLMSLGKAAALPNKKHFTDLNDYFDQLYRRPILITVKNETSEYQGKTYENTNIKKWEVSKFQQVAHKFKADAIDKAAVSVQGGVNAASNGPFASNGEAIDISDDQLPF